MPEGFDPIAGPEARILILGTLPGEESLRLGEYYADSSNSFWKIMRSLFGMSPELDYDGRCGALIRHGIALWDVCKSAERDGSQDNKVITSTIIPNDIVGFLAANPRVKLICFNGSKAYDFFRQKVSKNILSFPFKLLPSTSGVNTRMTNEQKRGEWRKALYDPISTERT